MDFLVTAINNLCPNCQYNIPNLNFDEINWFKENPFQCPTKQEIDAEIERLKQEYEYNQYQRDRAFAYPSIQDQLDILYHKGYDGWKDEISKVKENYPKPKGL